MIYDARPFKLEREMFVPLMRSLRTVLGVPDGTPMKVAREPTVGVVIPDLLIGLVHSSRRVLARSAFTTVEASVLALLEQQGLIATEDVLRRLFLPIHTGQRVLENLARSGAVRSNQEGTWTISEAARTSGVELIAVEAKLQLWKRALEQAESYLTFVDRSYVVLDGNRMRRPTAMAEAFRQSGVGLWIQYGFMVKEVVPAAPIRGITFSADRVRATEKVLRARSVSKRVSGFGMRPPPFKRTKPSALM